MLQATAFMATISTQVHSLLAVSFNAATEFAVLAGHCETFAETLIESNNVTLKMRLPAAGLKEKDLLLKR